MEFTKDISDNAGVVKMSGQFTFTDHQKFKEIIELLENKTISSLVLDVRDIEFVDSAALGMLLIAREEAKKADIKLELCNPTGQIEKMFKVSKFDTLFNIRSD